MGGGGERQDSQNQTRILKADKQLSVNLYDLVSLSILRKLYVTFYKQS